MIQHVPRLLDNIRYSQNIKIPIVNKISTFIYIIMKEPILLSFVKVATDHVLNGNTILSAVFSCTNNRAETRKN